MLMERSVCRATCCPLLLVLLLGRSGLLLGRSGRREEICFRFLHVILPIMGEHRAVLAAPAVLVVLVAVVKQQSQ